jgi:hypothetical protein
MDARSINFCDVCHAEMLSLQLPSDEDRFLAQTLQKTAGLIATLRVALIQIGRCLVIMGPIVSSHLALFLPSTHLQSCLLDPP